MLPFFSEARHFPPHISRPAAIDVAALARVIYAESRGEPVEGQEWVAFAVINISTRNDITVQQACNSRGIASGMLEASHIETAAWAMKVVPRMGYTHWLNKKSATSKKWLAFSIKQTGEQKYSHWFFDY